MAKNKASFEITAYDQHGERRPIGGDPFAISVRGAAMVYAKLNDLGDGSYRVDYKPSTSGAYTISITLHGVPMPGSPFALTVLAPRADSARCVPRGEALKSVIARQPSCFDVEFIDAFGHVAQAEDLDVYVEPRPIAKVPEDAPPLPTEGIIWAIVAPNLPKPLIVRSTGELESERIGEIGPGSMVGVLETRDLSDGSRRARVVYRPGSSKIGAAALLRSPPRSPDRSRPSSPATTRTNTPCHTPGRTPVSTPGRSRPSTPGRPNSARPSTPGRTNSPGRSPRRSPAASPRSPRMSSLFANPLDGQGTRSGTPRVPSFARPIGEFLSANMKRSRSPPSSIAKALEPGELNAGEVGWVTAAKDGKETLVLRHLKLNASRRQSQMHLWSKQLAAEANRKAACERSHRSTEESRAARMGASCAHELEADSRGIAFAYGGVEPGTLHAHGKLIKTHSVHYSVGRAGQYLLHVGIRNQSAALPGSPFELTVKPGNAHPVATSLPMDEFGCAKPLTGIVGDAGSVVIATSDRMGNRCIVGGAPLKVETKSPELRTSQVDNEDGTYALQWLGEVSGNYELYVTIDQVNVTGSPCELTLLSARPEVSKCEVSGNGLSNAVAGEKVQVMVRCKDRFSNPTTPGTSMSFGLALAPPAETATVTTKKDKDKDRGKDEAEKKEKKEKKEEEEEAAASTLPSKDFEGRWMAEGEYEIKYIAENAGDYELHLWCDVDGNGTRQKLPGSPFQLHVVAANASAAGSVISGADAIRNQPLTAGERLELQIYFRDDYGNACAPPDPRRNRLLQGANMTNTSADEEQTKQSARRTASSATLTNKAGKAAEAGKAGARTAIVDKEEGMVAKLVTPHEEEVITEKLRRGDAVGSFSLGYELLVAGQYEAHFTLNGSHLTGSPVCFRVKPSPPSGRSSTLHPPANTPPVIGVLYELLLIAEDKYGNKLDRGGGNVQARALGPSASPASTVDNGDGTYGVRFTAGAVGEYRVEVRLDNIKIKGSPHLINFTEPTAAQKRQLAASAPASAKGVLDTLIDETGDASEDPSFRSASAAQALHSSRDQSPERSQDGDTPPAMYKAQSKPF